MEPFHEPFRWGILGCGRMASDFADELLLHPEATLAAVASSDRGRAALFAEQKGGARALDSYEQLIACDDVDIVYIATHTENHFESAMRCIEHRKPVLVEKPICMDESELRCLIAAAKERQVFCMEAVWMLFFPAIARIEEVLAPIGPIKRLDASFRIDIPFHPSHRLYDPVHGGALLDIGIYPLFFTHRLFCLKNARIVPKLSFSPAGADDEGEITLTYPNDVVAHLDYSLRDFRPHVAVIEGQNGRAVFEDFFHPKAVTVTARNFGEMRTTYRYPLKGYHFEIDAVHEALKAGKTACDLAPLSASLEVLSAMNDILEKSRKRG